MSTNHRTLRILCAFLFLFITILSILVCVYTLTWTIIDRVLLFITFIAAISVWKSDHWGPRVGIWMSLINIAYAGIELALIHSVDLGYYSVAVPAVYLNTPLIIMSVITCIICIKLYRVQELKLKRDIEVRKNEKPGENGNCPKCGFNEIKFIDGVDYKCTRCGEIY